MLEALLTTPAVSVMLITVLVAEAVVLIAIWKIWQVGLAPRQIIGFLGAGIAFACALGFALAGPNAAGISISLCFAFVFHAVDLIMRWRITP